VSLRALDPRALRAALWAYRAVRTARRQLRESGLEDIRLPALPELPLSAGRGVAAVLRRQPHTCLERAIVLQRWRAAHGDPRDVVVGVRGPSQGFRAHAWLEDETSTADAASFTELRRVRP
jgi:hypothetical protein